MYLNEKSPRYIGGILIMLNVRLFKYWHDLPEALRPGQPQNEVKYGEKGLFEALYKDPVKLEIFLNAMTGLSRLNFETFAAKFDFSKFKTLCDVGGATGLLAWRWPRNTRTSNALRGIWRSSNPSPASVSPAPAVNSTRPTAQHS